MIYYQSVENGSINRDVYAINIDGKGKTRLSQKRALIVLHLVQISSISSIPIQVQLQHLIFH